MTRREKSIGLLGILTQCLLRAEKNRREIQLGDRSTYLGVSDISRGSECVRAAVTSKLSSFPSELGPDREDIPFQGGLEEIKRVIQRLLTLARGHWVEAGMLQALSLMDLKLIHQLEITANYQSVNHGLIPVQGHLDFTLVWETPRPTVRILEIKSYGKELRDTLYTSYESQIKLQVGLLHRLWNEKCFSVKDAAGLYRVKYQTFPELCRQLFGINLPCQPERVDIEGWVVSIAPDDADSFGPYQPDMASLSWLLEIGATIWDHVHQIRAGNITLNDIPYCTGFHPLCDWCDFNADCPKYRSVEMPAYEQDLIEYSRLKKEAALAKARLQEFEKRMVTTYRRIATQNGSPVHWIRANSYEFTESSYPGKIYTQNDLLRSELGHLFGDDQKRVDEFLAKVQYRGKSYSKCMLRKINKRKQLPNEVPHGQFRTAQKEQSD